MVLVEKLIQEWWDSILNGVELPLKDKVHSLGVLLDSALLLEATAKNAFAHYWLVCQLQPFLRKANLATIIHALMTSQIDYCNALWLGLSLKIVSLKIVHFSWCSVWQPGYLRTPREHSIHILCVLSDLHLLPRCTIWSRIQGVQNYIHLVFWTLEELSPSTEPAFTLCLSSEALLCWPIASRGLFSGDLGQNLFSATFRMPSPMRSSGHKHALILGRKWKHSCVVYISPEFLLLAGCFTSCWFLYLECFIVCIDETVLDCFVVNINLNGTKK